MSTFFGRGPAPQIARINMPAATAPGRNFGSMFANLGEQAGNALKTFYDNKEKSDNADMQIGALLEGLSPERQKELESGEGDIGKALTAMQKGELGLAKKQGLIGALTIMQKQDIDKEARKRQTQQYRAGQRFINRISGAIGSEKEIEESNQRLSELAPRFGKDGVPFAFTPEQKEAYDEELQNNQRLKSPLLEGTQTDLINAFADENPAVASMATNMFLKNRETPRGGFTQTIMGDDGTPIAVRFDQSGNFLKVLGDAPSTRPYMSVDEQMALQQQKGQLDSDLDRLDEIDGSLRQNINTGETARNAIITLNKMPEKSTGGFNEQINSLIKYADSVGFEFDPQTLKDVSNAEVFMQQTGDFLFQSIQQTKGSISNAEMRIFQSINPGMIQTKAGNMAMLKFIEAAGERARRKLEYKQGLQAQGTLASEMVRMIDKFDKLPENNIVKILEDTPNLLLEGTDNQKPTPSNSLITPTGGKFTPLQ